MLAANIAQGGAALAVAVKTKNSELKQLASSSGVTAVLGITEPAMYGVNLKLKRPFIAVMIGGAAGGLYAGLVGVKGYGFASPGLAALPVFMGPNGVSDLINAAITCAIAFVISFVAAYVLGFEEEADEEEVIEEQAVTTEKLEIVLKFIVLYKVK